MPYGFLVILLSFFFSWLESSSSPERPFRVVVGEKLPLIVSTEKNKDSAARRQALLLNVTVCLSSNSFHQEILGAQPYM